MQLLDSDWPANILAGSYFQAQETRALSPDGVCALERAWLDTRLLVQLAWLNFLPVGVGRGHLNYLPLHGAHPLAAGMRLGVPAGSNSKTNDQ